MKTSIACSGKTASEGTSAADEKRKRIFDFVRGALAHSSHDLLGPDGMTLAQAVDCPSAAMRAQVLCPLSCCCQYVAAVQLLMTDVCFTGVFQRQSVCCTVLGQDGSQTPQYTAIAWLLFFSCADGHRARLPAGKGLGCYR